ncbi:TPA: hypothetical protein ACP2SW_004362 [Escherichia coli]|uniref:Uncharacterized protein n=1 Tax=Escherichia coli TaxID=562 RepID=A0A6L7C471_ECOLX|nr:hypothetical protein [Escherichia coli]EFU6056156.1 hypothetical protein [Escherichia coli]EGK9462044.1 hypothetical protein [Escherichia coli]MBA8438907.1 hypothetical protein [Escherichia coli]MDD8932631.1 hypothetical protein [Escherichia coli]MWT73627.1 hypothetical protein [Escherichia coli]
MLFCFCEALSGFFTPVNFPVSIQQKRAYKAVHSYSKMSSPMALEKGIAEFITTDFFSEAARTALRDVAWRAGR